MANLALFDFDRTVTSNDNFSAFAFSVINPFTLVVGKLAVSPVFLGYKLGIVSSSCMRRCVVAIGLRGRSEAELRKLGSRYAAEVLPKFVRPFAIERLKWHQGQGDKVVIVSASLEFYLSPWCKEMGVDLICTKLESCKGVLTGKYKGKDCCGEEKAIQILSRYTLSDYNQIYAYGDSREDEAMLRLAHKRYLNWKEIN